MSEGVFLIVDEHCYLNPRYIIEAERTEAGLVVRIEGKKCPWLLEGRDAERAEHYLLQHTPIRLKLKKQP